MRVIFSCFTLAFGLAANPTSAVIRVNINSGIVQPLPVAVPAFTTPYPVATKAGSTAAIGNQVALVIAADLASSGLFRPLDAAIYKISVAVPSVIAPQFLVWRALAAQALITGSVSAGLNGGITIDCHLYDVFAAKRLARQLFITKAANWRRVAHKCADLVYSRLTGEAGYFDSRIVYVSETGPKRLRIKRLAVMDQDGAGHRFLTSGQALVLTPRFAPNGQMMAYMSFAGNRPRVWLYNFGNGRNEPIGGPSGMTSSPRFSPNGLDLVYAMSQSSMTHLYKMDLTSRRITRLTNGPGINTAASYSPDGSKIAFESDRSGGQQIYVMNADGTGEQRISFGGGRSGTPVWSPRGDLIAFTRMDGDKMIGVMKPDGSEVRLLTSAHRDEAPTWSPNGRVIMFFRTTAGSRGKADLHSIDRSGMNERQIKTPLDASDPDWSPLLP
jgi:TolB protein